MDQCFFIPLATKSFIHVERIFVIMLRLLNFLHERELLVFDWRIRWKVLNKILKFVYVDMRGRDHIFEDIPLC